MPDGEPSPLTATEGTSQFCFSPDGQWFAVTTGTANCFFDPSAMWVSIYDTTTWEEAYRIPLGGGTNEASFNGDPVLNGAAHRLSRGLPERATMEGGRWPPSVQTP